MHRPLPTLVVVGPVARSVGMSMVRAQQGADSLFCAADIEWG